jgi:hypothetical protein
MKPNTNGHNVRVEQSLNGHGACWCFDRKIILHIVNQPKAMFDLKMA